MTSVCYVLKLQHECCLTSSGCSDLFTFTANTIVCVTKATKLSWAKEVKAGA